MSKHNSLWTKLARLLKDSKMSGTELMEQQNIPALSPNKKQKLAPQFEGKENLTTKPVLRFAKLSENAQTPTRGTAQSAGLDLHSAYDYTIPAKCKKLCKTDIQIACPDGCYARVAPRSGLTHKYFIDVGAGVIDQDYRGNVGVILFNFGDDAFEVQKGDRIAQLILEKICIPEVEECPTLDVTQRGAGGFGSTGKN